MEKLNSSSYMSKFFCITDLIQFMMLKVEKLMKGSLHKENLSIVHNALVLMKAKETISWAIEKNQLHRWFLPINGLQDGTPYAGRPVGNIPESVPLDDSLNIDILHSLRFHCVLSHFVLDWEGTNEEERSMRFTNRNHQSKQSYMGIKDGNTFFSESHPIC